jgi:hypothetical protein
MNTSATELDPRLVNAVARAFWTVTYTAENPGVAREALQEAWTRAAAEHRKLTRRALMRLSAQGITISGEITAAGQTASAEAANA